MTNISKALALALGIFLLGRIGLSSMGNTHLKGPSPFFNKNPTTDMTTVGGFDDFNVNDFDTDSDTDETGTDTGDEIAGGTNFAAVYSESMLNTSMNINHHNFNPPMIPRNPSPATLSVPQSGAYTEEWSRRWPNANFKGMLRTYTLKQRRGFTRRIFGRRKKSQVINRNEFPGGPLIDSPPYTGTVHFYMPEHKQRFFTDCNLNGVFTEDMTFIEASEYFKRRHFLVHMIYTMQVSEKESPARIAGWLANYAGRLGANRVAVSRYGGTVVSKSRSRKKGLPFNLVLGAMFSNVLGLSVSPSSEQITIAKTVFQPYMADVLFLRISKYRIVRDPFGAPVRPTPRARKRVPTDPFGAPLHPNPPSTRVPQRILPTTHPRAPRRRVLPTPQPRASYWDPPRRSLNDDPWVDPPEPMSESD